MRLRTSLLRLVSIALPLLLAGCASFNRIAEYPTPKQPASVAIAATPLSKMNELPVGAFYDEKRQIVISGHQKGVGWSMLFGVVGVLVADSANKSSAESRFGASAHNSVTDLGTIAREVVAAEIGDGHAAEWSLATSAGAHLHLSPYAVFTVQKSGAARLHAMVRAEIPGQDGKPAWSVRYFARAPGEFPVEGADGWMAGSRFADGMRVALRRAVRACLDDTQGRLAGTRTVKARGLLPYMNTDALEWSLLVVQENDQDVVARLLFGDAMVMAGTHVLDRADFTFTDAKLKDPRK